MKNTRTRIGICLLGGVNLPSLTLVNAVERLPEVPIYLFSLACYEAQLGDGERAKKHLQHAIELRGELRRAALVDEDLRPLRDVVWGLFPLARRYPNDYHECHMNHPVIASCFAVVDIGVVGN